MLLNVKSKSYIEKACYREKNGRHNGIKSNYRMGMVKYPCLILLSVSKFNMHKQRKDLL